MLDTCSGGVAAIYVVGGCGGVAAIYVVGGCGGVAAFYVVGVSAVAAAIYVAGGCGGVAAISSNGAFLDWAHPQRPRQTKYRGHKHASCPPGTNAKLSPKPILARHT